MKEDDLFVKKASVFDLDHTLIQINSSFAFCKYLVSCGVLPISAFFYAIYIFFRHRFFGLTLSQMHEKVFRRVLLGKDLVCLEGHAALFFSSHLLKKCYAPALALFQKAKEAGHYTALISSSPDFLVRPFAAFFGFDDWKGTEYQVSSTSCLQTISTLIDGEAKASYIKNFYPRLGIRSENIIAYSDSYVDLPFLLAAGEAVAVNPDQKLKKFFKKKKWRII